MAKALEQARLAYQLGEVPVGAVLVDSLGEIVATGYNKTIYLNDPTAHAEMIALRQAAKVKNNYRLPDLTLYVTLEPCMMCFGAIIHSRIHTLIYGAQDPKTGVCGGFLSLNDERQINHRCKTISGVLELECSMLIKQFFKERRLQQKTKNG